MNNQTLEFDTFYTALSQLLQGDEMPTPDFASRVMAQVKETAQEPKTLRRPRRSTWTMVAACAAVMILCAPFLGSMINSGKSADAKADSAAPAEAREEAMVAMDTTTADGDASGGDNGYSANENEKAAGTMEARDAEPEAPGESASGVLTYNNKWAQMDLPVVILEPEVFEDASIWLLEQGYPYEDGYHLTAADVALLNTQFPELELEEVDCVLQEA